MTGDRKRTFSDTVWTAQSLSGGDQPDAPAGYAQGDPPLPERQGVIAEHLAPPAVQGGDVRRFLDCQAVDVVGAGDQAWGDVVILAFGGEQNLQQGDQGRRGAGTVACPRRGRGGCGLG